MPVSDIRNGFQGFLRFVVIAQLESYRSLRTFDIELTGQTLSLGRICNVLEH